LSSEPERPARRARTAACVVALLGVLVLVAATVRAMVEASRPIVIRDRVDRDDAYGIAFSPEGDVIAKASRRGARLLSIPDGRVVRTLIGRGVVYRIAFTPGGERVVTGDRDGNVIVWSARTGDVERRLPPHRARVMALAVSPDGNRVASSCFGSEEVVRVSSIADGSVARVFSCSSARAIAFSPRGDRIAFAGPFGGTNICSLSDGATVCEMEGNGGDIAFARDGASLALALDNGNITIHDATTGALLRTITGRQFGNTEHVAAMPNGDAWLVSENLHTTARDGEIRLFSTRDGTCVRSFAVPGPIQSLAVSLDGARIAVGSADGTIRIWRTSLPFAFGR
jgi:WD40 repeat protein